MKIQAIWYDMDRRIKEIMDITREWLDCKKVGSITINFFKGGISNIVIKHSIKLGETESS